MIYRVVWKRKTHEDFVKELNNKNNKIEVLGLYNIANDTIKVQCLKCTGIWEPLAASLLRGNSCPYCCPSPKKILIGLNDMWTTNKELAKLLLNPEDGYKYTQHSSRKVSWKCPDCKKIIKNISINTVSRYGLSCSKCGDGISFPNKIGFNLLEQLNTNFIPEYSPKWIKPKRYDFWFMFNSKEYILEMDGKLGHGNINLLSGQTAQETRDIDENKDILAKENNIEVIRIDCKESDLNYIKINLINSELNNIFDLSIINWDKLYKYACTNLVKVACDHWNSGIKNTREIREVIKLSHPTIVRYLKQGAELGWCDYDPKKEFKRNLEDNKIKSANATSKRVMCIETKEIFKSISEAAKNVINGSDSHISSCCKGKRKSCGRLEDGTLLHWEYI